MSARENEPRIWARRDRTVVPPQRRLARQMRAAPTEAERKLWWQLRHRLPVEATHFRRQVRLGRYIVDFASHRARLVIEVDGSQHAERTVQDMERMRFIESHGYRVLRYWNNDVLTNINGVLEDILSAITTTPTPNPSPSGQGNRIWKKGPCRKLFRADRARHAEPPFAFRFWSVPDPILGFASHTKTPRWAKPRMRFRNFHMRLPCPQGGGEQSTVGGGA